MDEHTCGTGQVLGLAKLFVSLGREQCMVYGWYCGSGRLCYSIGLWYHGSAGCIVVFPGYECPYHVVLGVNYGCSHVKVETGDRLIYVIVSWFTADFSVF